MDTLCTAKCKSRSEVVWNSVCYFDCGTCLQDHLFLVMDYLSEGDLWHQLEKVNVFSQKRTKFYNAEIILALQYIHKKGIIHW